MLKELTAIIDCVQISWTLGSFANDWLSPLLFIISYLYGFL